MSTIWTIAIDWDRNDSFTDTYDDVTGRVVKANWFLGMRQPYREIADNSTLTLVLNNEDRRYSPEYSAGPLASKIVPQRPVHIQSYDGTTVRTHWKGWVETIQPAVNKRGERLTVIVATGPMQFFLATETNLALQENKRTDEVIAELIKEVVFPPALSGAWVLERVGNSELGKTTYLADTSGYSELDEGIVTLAMAGDNWVRDGGNSDKVQDAFDVYRAIRDITAAEHGKFLFDREGKAHFWNRHHLLQDPAVAATFDDDLSEMAYTYASPEHVKNEVIVICHPRTISTSDQDVLWELGDAVIRVEPGKTREIYIKYKDESDNRIGGKDVTVGDLEFDQGTATATVEAEANGANLIFNNTGTKPAIIKKCIVRGRKIVDSGEMEATATDSASIVDFGRRTLRINLPSIDDLEQAQYIADFERNRRGQPWGAVGSITVISHGKRGGGHHEDQLNLTLGDLISVEETQTGHDRQHYIVGEAHELTHGANFWKTTWYLEVAPELYPWKLEAANSELGGNTRLAY